MSVDALIARYVEEDPHRPGPAHARLTPWGTPVWALISYWQQAVCGDLAQAAADYEISLEAAEASVAYYERNKAMIDARILLNSA